MAGDTLRIETHTPTMEYLSIWTLHPDGKGPANSSAGGMGPTQRGPVGLEPYECAGSLSS
jgi:hypothetical protein